MSPDDFTDWPVLYQRCLRDRARWRRETNPDLLRLMDADLAALRNLVYRAAEAAGWPRVPLSRRSEWVAEGRAAWDAFTAHARLEDLGDAMLNMPAPKAEPAPPEALRAVG